MEQKELSVFPVGNKNEQLAQHFIGHSYLSWNTFKENLK